MGRGCLHMQELARTLAKDESQFPNPGDFNCVKVEDDVADKSGAKCGSLNCYSVGSDAEQFDNGIKTLIDRNRECKTALDEERLEASGEAPPAEEKAAPEAAPEDAAAAAPAPPEQHVHIHIHNTPAVPSAQIQVAGTFPQTSISPFLAAAIPSASCGMFARSRRREELREF